MKKKLILNEKDLVNNLKPFENRWVALVDGEVIAVGNSVAETKRKADETGRREYVFYFVPSSAISFAPAILWG